MESNWTLEADNCSELACQREARGNESNGNNSDVDYGDDDGSFGMSPTADFIWSLLFAVMIASGIIGNLAVLWIVVGESTLG